MWVSTWALFLTKPSDLGYPDTGYELPELRVHEEIVNVDNSTAGADRDGQVKIFREAALGLADAAKERRDNMQEKIARVVEIINRPETRTTISFYGMTWKLNGWNYAKRFQVVRLSMVHKTMKKPTR